MSFESVGVSEGGWGRHTEKEEEEEEERLKSERRGVAGSLVVSGKDEWIWKKEWMNEMNRKVADKW